MREEVPSDLPHAPGELQLHAMLVGSMKVYPKEILGEEWGRTLGKMIGQTEARVASYKKLVQDAYKVGDREFVDLFKESQHDEERFLKKLRYEKTAWNESVPWSSYRFAELPEGHTQHGHVELKANDLRIRLPDPPTSLDERDSVLFGEVVDMRSTHDLTYSRTDQGCPLRGPRRRPRLSL